MLDTCHSYDKLRTILLKKLFTQDKDAINSLSIFSYYALKQRNMSEFPETVYNDVKENIYLGYELYKLD